MNAVLRPTPDAIDAAPARGSVECVIPTTESQREVWLGAMLSAEASLAYNESVLLRLRGTLDGPALSRALARLVQRHQSLRATLSPDGRSMLVGGGDAPALELRDLRTLDATGRAQALDAAHRDAVCTPFPLEHGPLFRAALYRLGDAEHELVMSAHHVVCDGWSWAVIAEQLGHLYADEIGEGLPLRAAPSYAAFAAEEAAEAAGPAMQAHVDHWLARFAGSLPVLELPTDRPRPAVRGFDSQRIERGLDRALVSAMRAASAKSGTSLFAGLLAAFAATLHRLSGQDDIVVGIPASGQLSRDMPGLVGHCVNLLPLRLAVGGQLRFDALMGECGTAVLDAFEHQSLTYGALLGKLSLERDASRQPLVSVMFNLDPDVAGSAQNFAGLAVTQDTVPRRYENFELFLNLRPAEGGLVVEAQYNTGLFDEASVRRWLDMFECLLRSAVQAPDQTIGRLALLSPEAARELLALQPAPSPLAGLPLAHAGFEASALLQPDRPAIRDGARRCSYATLDAQSNRLAHALRERGMGRGQRVGLCLERGIDMVVALLAVLKSGAAYVPLDPGFPQARLDHYAEDARLGLLLTTSDIATAPRGWRADAAERVFELDRDTAWLRAPAGALPPSGDDAGPEDAAYVIYTSGSTGTPKGVCVPHRAVANLLQSMRKAPGLGEGDRLAAVTTLSFDIAVAELLLPLAAGAEIVMVPRETAMDGRRLRALLEEEDVTVLQATPGMWQLLLDAQWPGAPGLRGWIGGEPVRGRLALELLERCAQLWNVYGPTETTVWSTAWNMRRDTIAAHGVSIGQPIDNTSVWILDAALQPCPVGVPGELCIGGEGLALGYLERPELSAERFVSARILGQATALYRTGDRGRWRNDGLLEHLGRLDFQVKVRGYRIEPGEIEARCNEAAGVSRSVVVAREDRPGDVRLVAYLALQPGAAGAAFELGALMQQLRENLPAFMLPQHVVTLPVLPTLPNGKLDRVALPPPGALPRAVVQRGAGPANEIERKVLAAMEQVLSLPGMDMGDDFFTLGGHSLLAARLATLLSREFDLALPLRTLFEAPTAQRLAAAIAALRGAGETRQTALPCHFERELAPMTPSQERIRFMEELHPGRSVYNAPSAQRLLGAFDAARFEAVLREIIRRQPALRTCMGVDQANGAPVQRIARAVDFSLPVIDLRELPADQREAELAERMQELADRPIDIHRAPMLHAALFRIDEDAHVFVFVPHHLVWDGWSFDLLQAELAALYDAAERGRPHALPALATTHGDYAEWLAGWMATPEFEAQRALWRERAAAVAAPRLPRTDMPRRAGRSGQGGSQWIAIDLPATQRLRETARELDVTLSMFTFAIHALAMGRTIGSDTLVVANPVRGRQQPETENVMGVFNNMLPVSLRIDLGLTLPAYLRYVKQELLALMACQQVPFERLVAEPGGPARAAGAYQTMFSFQDARERGSRIGSLRTQQMHLLQRGATDDIGVWLLDTPHGLEGALIYNADIYLRETGARLRERYLELLRRAADRPHATLAQLASEEGSPSAAYLRKLAAEPPEALAPQAAAAALPLADVLPPEHARLAQIWADVIGIDVNEIRASDNFFDLGGDSLLVQRSVERTALTLGHRVEPRRYLFENLAQLAASPPSADITPAEAGGPKRAPTPGRTLGLLGRTLSGWLRGDRA
jgi:amino acid adenylation domain-containing protein